MPVRADDRRRRLDEARVRVDVVNRRAFVHAGLTAHLVLVEAVVHGRGEDLRRARLRSADDDRLAVEPRAAQRRRPRRVRQPRPSRSISAVIRSRGAAPSTRSVTSTTPTACDRAEAVVVEHQQPHRHEATAPPVPPRWAADHRSQSIAPPAPPYPPDDADHLPSRPARRGDDRRGSAPDLGLGRVHGIRPDAGAALLLHRRRPPLGVGERPRARDRDPQAAVRPDRRRAADRGVRDRRRDRQRADRELLADMAAAARAAAAAALVPQRARLRRHLRPRRSRASSQAGTTATRSTPSRRCPS